MGDGWDAGKSASLAPQRRKRIFYYAPGIARPSQGLQPSVRLHLPGSGPILLTTRCVNYKRRETSLFEYEILVLVRCVLAIAGIGAASQAKALDISIKNSSGVPNEKSMGDVRSRCAGGYRHLLRPGSEEGRQVGPYSGNFLSIEPGFAR